MSLNTDDHIIPLGTFNLSSVEKVDVSIQTYFMESKQWIYILRDRRIENDWSISSQTMLKILKEPLLHKKAFQSDEFLLAMQVFLTHYAKFKTHLSSDTIEGF